MQKLNSIALLFGLFTAAIFAQNCSNPMLNRTDVQARFGGSANILNTSRIAGNLTICPFLSGQSVCVSDAGFASLQKFLDDYKQNFTQRSERADQGRYGGIGEAMKRTDMNDTKMRTMFTLGMLFNQTVLTFNASGASQPYNFTAFYSMIQQMRLTSNNTNDTKPHDKDHDQDQDGRRRGEESHEPEIGGHQSQPGNHGPRSLQDVNTTQNESESSGNFSDSGNNTNRTEPPRNRSDGPKDRNPPHKWVGNHTEDRNNSSDMNNTNRTRSINDTQSGNLRRLQTPHEKENHDSRDHAQKNWMDLQNNLMQAKSKCATSVMKHLYFASCMAASANATAFNQSNSSGSPFKISPDACSGFKSKCVDYFTYSAAAENTRAMMMNANSSFAVSLYSIVTSGNDTSVIFNALNNLAVIVLEEMSANSSNFTVHKAPSSLVCNNTNSNASDCNYICTNVLNATGFDENAFNTISTTNSTSRRHLDSSSSVTIDSNGVNPEASIGDHDSAVVVSVSSVPDTSSGSKVFASLVMAIVSLTLALA